MRLIKLLGLVIVFYSLTSLPLRAASNIGVRIESGANTIFDGVVETNGCTISDTSGKTHAITKSVAICALDSASKKGGFSYSVEGQSLGFFLESVSGINQSWFFWVNKGFSPVGFGEFLLKDNDLLVLNTTNTYPAEKKPSPEIKPTLQPEIKPSQPTLPETKLDATKTKPEETQVVTQTQPIPQGSQTISKPNVTQESLNLELEKPLVIVPPAETENKVESTEISQPEVVIPEILAAKSEKIVAVTNLPKSGPEVLLVFLGPSLILSGKVLRSKTNPPFTRFLKPVPYTKGHYLH